MSDNQEGNSQTTDCMWCRYGDHPLGFCPVHEMSPQEREGLHSLLEQLEREQHRLCQRVEEVSAQMMSIREALGQSA